ncbi:uncharacterized protein LOC134235442 isoform X2 [Saccostrea cucullata]
MSFFKSIRQKMCRWRQKYKKHLIVILGIYCVYYIHTIYNREVEYIFVNENTEKKCELPNLDAHDNSVMKFFHRLNPIQCDKSTDLVFVDSLGYLQVNNTAVYEAGHAFVSCSYSVINRKGDYNVEKEPEVRFLKPVYVHADFFLVKCKTDKNAIAYEKLHHSIDYKSRRRQFNFLNESNEQLNVYIFGLDSLSRLAAERTIPQTLRYVEQNLGGYIMKGQTKVGVNTFPNLVSLLTGKVCYSKELPSYEEILDPFPFIWKNFSASGYATLLAEDSPGMGSFTYWKGFKEQPCLHYMRPYYLAMKKFGLPDVNSGLLEWENSNIRFLHRSALCIGNTPKHKILMNYYRQFIEMYGNTRKFALSWLTDLTHEYDNIVQLADNDFKLFFKWMKESGKLSNSTLILMSDHGIMQNKIKNTIAGRTENRMPLFAIVIPPHIKSKYPHLHRNLKTNTKRLTTVFDAHETLVDILESNFERSKESVEKLKKLPRGISLFTEIPERRSCNDAEIPGDYCVCNSYEPINNDDKISKELAEFLVSYINKDLTKHKKKCAKLKLSKIKDTYLVKSNLQRREEREEFSIRNLFFQPDLGGKTYLSVIETVPGYALFEATIRSHDSFDVIGRVNRANKYGNQSSCIHDKLAEPFCYCNKASRTGLI